MTATRTTVSHTISINFLDEWVKAGSGTVPTVGIPHSSRIVISKSSECRDFCCTFETSPADSADVLP